MVANIQKVSEKNRGEGDFPGSRKNKRELTRCRLTPPRHKEEKREEGEGPVSSSAKRGGLGINTERKGRGADPIPLFTRRIREQSMREWVWVGGGVFWVRGRKEFFS